MSGLKNIFKHLRNVYSINFIGTNLLTINTMYSNVKFDNLIKKAFIERGKISPCNTK